MVNYLFVILFASTLSYMVFNVMRKVECFRPVLDNTPIWGLIFKVSGFVYLLCIMEAAAFTFMDFYHGAGLLTPITIPVKIAYNTSLVSVLFFNASVFMALRDKY